MTRARSTLLLLPLLFGMAHAPRSGRLGVFALIDKVVFEPNDSTPERMQVWGSFSLVDGGVQGGYAVSVARKGYMYFAYPTASAPVVRKEWADLKAVAGTGQAVGFGSWGYFGQFSALDPSTQTQIASAYVVSGPGMAPGAGPAVVVSSIRVRPASEPPAGPGPYTMNVGVVKLPEWSHADVIKKLREALKG